MGSVYAGLLASAGNEVLVVDRWAAHVEAINARGLRIEGASGERTVAVSAHTAPPDDEAEMIVIAAKAADVAGAAAVARRMMGEGSVVVTIQNGLGSADVVAADLGGELGAGSLMVGIAAGFGASIRAPGHAQHTGMHHLPIEAATGLA